MPVPRLTKENYVELYRRVLPASYIEPLEAEDDGVGMDVPYAFAAMMELADCASNKGTQSYFLRPHSDQTDEPAAGQRKAIGSFLVTRVGYAAEPITIPASTVIEAFRLDSYGDEELLGRYVTLAAATIAAGSGTTLLLPVEAEFPGYFGNLFADSAYLRFAPLGNSRIPCTVIITGFDAQFHRVASTIDDPFVDRFVATDLGRYARIVPDNGVVFETQPLYLVKIDTLDVAQQRMTPTIGTSSGDEGKLCTVELLELGDVGLALSQPTAITGGNGGMLDARGVDLGTSRLTGEGDESFESRLEALDDVVSPPAVMRAIDRVLGPSGIAWRLMETGDPKGLGGRVWDLHPWDFGNLGSVVSGAAVYDVQGAVWLSANQTRRFFVIAVSSAIGLEPLLASRLWNEVNAIREAGVGFRLVIDSTL
jgi:hypothetical protein